MTALGQGSAGLALVMCFALLRSGRIGAAAILLAVQSASVAVAAVVLHQALMAIAPIALGGGLWLLWHHKPMPDARTLPVGGTKLGIGAGAVLAVLCQSQGGLALPLAIILLAVLLAATRQDAWMQVIAVIAAANGLALAASVVGQPTNFPQALLLPSACLALPLPLAAGLLLPPGRSVAAPDSATRPVRPWVRAVPWVDLGLAVATLTGTLIVPLDPLASMLAPLLGLDGVIRAWARRHRHAITPTRRATALLQAGCTVVAVCLPNPIMAWIGVLAAMAMALLPAASRCRTRATLGFLAAGLTLFGVLVINASPTLLGYFSLFTGLATIAAVVPDLAVVVVILVLRLAINGQWAFAIQMLGCGIAAIALLACALLLTTRVRRHRVTLLLLSQASIAALAICTGHPDGRFAALVLLILLVLSRSAARLTAGPAGALAIAGLGGISPLGVFPGVVLVMLTFSVQAPWLLLPLGLALAPVVLASLPARMPVFSWPASVQSVTWVPLLLAIVAGWFAPDQLVQWWRLITEAAP